jgi:FKBP-type peptidyl-prolyl cis-trans isomerase SlyD
VITVPQSDTEKLPALAEGLRDLRAGERREIALSADQAYGYYDPELVIVRDPEELEFNGPIEAGETVIYLSQGQRRVFRVAEVSQNAITLDGNHPLAGQDLIFEIETVDARDATEEDLNLPPLQ